MATSYKQAVYSDFSGGYNDTSAAISISDDEFTISENADYSAEVKALQTRKGCVKQNDVGIQAQITDGFTWIIGSTQRECVVFDEALHVVHRLTDGTVMFEKMIDLPEHTTHIYPYVMYNTMYFTTGGEIPDFFQEDYVPKMYTWGDFDYSTETMYDANDNFLPQTGDVVRNDTMPAAGAVGHFYKSKGANGPNFDAIYDWEDVTDVIGLSSCDVREIKPYSAAKREIVQIEILSSALRAGTVTVTLYGENNIPKQVSFQVAQGDSVRDIVEAFPDIDGYTRAITDEHIVGFINLGDNEIRYTANQNHQADQAVVDPGDTGITLVVNTIQEGSTDDCKLDDIKKCTIFCSHSASHRVFAAGNPDDNAVYFSEIGYGNYWKSDLNKIYPAQNGMGKVTGLIELSEYLLVSYEHGWYAWKGTTPLEDANWKPLNIPYGCSAPRSLVMTPNSITFLAKEGIFCVSAAILNDAYVMMENQRIIRNLSDNKVEQTLRNMNQTAVWYADAVFYDDSYILAFPSSAESIYNDRVLKYDWSDGAFTLITNWMVHRWLKAAFDLYFTSTNYYLKAFEGFHDVNLESGEPCPIYMHVKTKEYHFGTPFSMKNAQLIGFIFQQHDAVESPIDIIIHAGYRKYEVKDVDLADSLYYNRLWGAAWGYREAIVKVIETIEPSNTFQIEFIKSCLDDPVTLIGIGFIYENTDYVSPTVLKDEVLLK